MNNLKKYTKDELIAKLKSQKENNSNLLIKFKNYFSQLWNLLSTFKDILAKLTFITLIIKFINIYYIFIKFWRILNTIVKIILDNL